MAVYLLMVILVGIPGIAGAIMVTEAAGRNNASNGVGLLLYAIILCGVFVYAFPVGRFTDTNFAIKMPAVLVTAILIGAVVGIVRRRSR